MNEEEIDDNEMNYKALVTTLNIAATMFAIGLLGIAIAEKNWFMSIPAAALLLCHALLVRGIKNLKKK